MRAHVAGHVAPGYERVRDAFAAGLDGGGAAFAACRHGRAVVDLWGGLADADGGRRWEADTLAPIFSGTKALATICLLRLVERGAIDLDAPVGRYWWSFRHGGRQEAHVRHVLAHTAGLPAVRSRELPPDALLSEALMAQTLGRERPAWRPGTTLCYHPLTFGWLVGELVRRADGRRIGRFFEEEVAHPLGLELWIGLPPSAASRVARLRLHPAWGASPVNDRARVRATPLRAATWDNPRGLWSTDGFDWWNEPRTQHAGVPAAGAIGTARSVAHLFSALVAPAENGAALLSSATVAGAVRRVSAGVDPLVGKPFAFGSGFALQTAQRSLGPPPDAFGHGGAGGSMHGAWPSQRVGFSYAVNTMRDDEGDTRARDVLGALWEAIGDET